MTVTVERNRLDEEESPYLRDHADNPVNWQPWDEEALAAAREQDKPIFLSVGYAACHWCHVMADESFDDEQVAAVLNESFVPVKVDREERPDIDSIYQTVCQRVSGRGGWPLSVWLTPEGEPFQVGTYFPREPRRGMPGFLDLLEDIAASWSDPAEREKMESRAAQWTAMVEGELEEVPDSAEQPGEDLIESAGEAAARSADRQEGGWGSGPKFPQAGRLHLLARAWEVTDRDGFEEVLVETLDAMADGGMYDHVGGGFHRYATDRDWTVPHFEKMLYDNAQLPRAYLAGYRITGDQRYAEVVRETLEFVQRELTHPDGGFFSTLGAQSEWEGEREEGAFYVWTPEQVHEALDDETMAELFCERYGVTERGNFEGKTVLTRARPPAGVAADHEPSYSETTDLLAEAREQLLEARERRPRPPRDEKVLAGWNGLMISAFAEAAVFLDQEYAQPAVEAMSFVREQLWDGERLRRRYSDGVVKIDGYLEDYAYLARGAFDLFQATRDPEHLGFALELAEAIEREFWDEQEGTLYFTPADGESLIARPQELTDQSTPSSIGVAVETLDTLDEFSPEHPFGEIAEQAVETHGGRVRSNPLQHASLTLAADTVTRGLLELTLVTDEPPEDWYDTLADRYLAPTAIYWRPLDGDRMEGWLDTVGLSELPAVWDRRETGDEQMVYACRAQTCSPPRTELTRALNWAERIL
jgi:uncharacterized protein YyaL (SSP411 family)